MINYNNRSFKPIQTSGNGEVASDTIFHYKQTGNIVTSEYTGGKIVVGHLLGIVDNDGSIEMRYHQVNDKGELMTGVCRSIPEIMPNGKLRLHESWKWTSGDESGGSSVLEEV